MSGDIYEITDSKSFAAIKHDWNRLLDKAEHPIIFMTWEWCCRWWESFAGKDSLWIVCVRGRTGELLGIAPLRNRHGVVTFVGDNIVCPDHLDILVTQEHAEHVSDLTLRYILREKSRHRLELNALRLDSIFEAAVKRLGILRRLGDRISIVDGLPSPYISLSDSWPDYLGTMKVKDRRNQTRYFRRLAVKYGERVHIGEARERNEVREIMAELKRLHTRSWAARNIKGVFSDERFYQFHVHDDQAPT